MATLMLGEEPTTKSEEPIFMPQRDKARKRIAHEAKFAAINAIYENLTDAERQRFLAWQKGNVKPGGKTKAYDWPGLKVYLDAVAEELRSGR